MKNGKRYFGPAAIRCLSERKTSLTALSRLDRGTARQLCHSSPPVTTGQPDIAQLINDYYATGSFQKAIFTEKREMLLHFLDSADAAAKGPSEGVLAGGAAFVSNQRQEIPP